MPNDVRELRITVDSLRPAPYNPRTITEEHARALSHSLTTFGDISGIVWNRRTGFLVAGHQRLDVLRRQYPDLTLVQDGDEYYLITPAPPAAPQHVFGVRIVDWDEATERAANLAANAPTLQGEFTSDAIALLEGIQQDTPEIARDLRFDDLLAALDTHHGGNALAQPPRTVDTTPALEGGVQHQVVVTCTSTDQQEALAQELTSRGLACRLLSL